LSIYEDQSGTLWFVTYGGGINMFDRKRNNFIHYKNEPQNASSLSSNNARSIFEDNSGILWIGTLGGGLNKVDRKKKKFTHFKNNPNNFNSLSHNSVRSIYEDNSGGTLDRNLWLKLLELLGSFL